MDADYYIKNKCARPHSLRARGGQHFHRSRALLSSSHRMCVAHATGFFFARSPFKKPERQNEARIKWTIGVLLGLGLFAFWMHRSPDSFDQRQSMYAAQSSLRPLAGAATKPSGGGMVEAGVAAAAEHSPHADAAAAAVASAGSSSSSSSGASGGAAAAGAGGAVAGASNATSGGIAAASARGGNRTMR